jgi:Flp pilus assembly protein TadG
VRSRQARPQRGALMVETALVLPLLILTMLGGVDLGMWVFQRTQAASAARSGARVGILRFRHADQAYTADETAILRAVARDADTTNFSTEIRCVGPGDTISLPGGCQSASVVGPDRILVRVTWERPAVTPLTKMLFGATQRVSGTAVMVIHGRPSGVIG